MAAKKSGKKMPQALHDYWMGSGHFGGSKPAPKTATVKPTKPGQKPITFKKGGLHASTGTPPGKKIPAAKRTAARSGKLGPKAEKQELFAENVLTGGKKKRK